MKFSTKTALAVTTMVMVGCNATPTAKFAYLECKLSLLERHKARAAPENVLKKLDECITLAPDSERNRLILAKATYAIQIEQTDTFKSALAQLSKSGIYEIDGTNIYATLQAISNLNPHDLNGTHGISKAGVKALNKARKEGYAPLKVIGESH